jgi:hypothetical protein
MATITAFAPAVASGQVGLPAPLATHAIMADTHRRRVTCPYCLAVLSLPQTPDGRAQAVPLPGARPEAASAHRRLGASQRVRRGDSCTVPGTAGGAGEHGGETLPVPGCRPDASRSRQEAAAELKRKACA